MSGGEFAAIEARVRVEGLTWAIDALEDRAALLAAVRERDNTIARVRELIESAPHLHDPWADDWKGEQVVPVDRLLAALDPQETP